jgi:hypothetical protein
VTAIGLAVPEACAAPGDAVTVNDVTGEPPVDTGATNATMARPLPGAAATAVGAPGGPEGVTALDGADGGPVPNAFAAVTVKEYATPFVRPVTVIGLAAPVAVSPPGDAVTVYSVIGDPPFDAGAAKLAVACSFPVVAATATGAPGTVNGVTAFEGADAGPVPTALVAVTVNV